MLGLLWGIDKLRYAVLVWMSPPTALLVRTIRGSNVVTIIIIIIFLQISISVRSTERSSVFEGHFRRSAA